METHQLKHPDMEKRDTMNTHNRFRMLRRGGGSLLAAAVLAVSACDTEILNPGPVEDQFLDSLLAHEAPWSGAPSATCPTRWTRLRTGVPP
jgi:hypothetical protein